MVTLEEFLTIMGHVIEQEDKDNLLTDVLECKDTTGWISTAPDLIEDVLQLLGANLNEEEGVGYDWIAWYMWEVRDSQREVGHMWTHYDGDYYKFYIDDLEDLYYLVKGDLGRIKRRELADEEEIKAKADSCDRTSFNNAILNSMNYVESEN